MASRGYNRLGKRIALANGFQVIDGTSLESGITVPKSGTAGTTVREGHGAPPGGLYVDVTSKTMFVNEGTSASPYWTPVGFNQKGLFGWWTDFRDGVGIATSDTSATITVAGSGLRIHGDSLVDTDAGVTVAMTSDGQVASVVSGNENADCIALSFGTGTTALFKPSLNGTMVMDALLSNLTAITSRSLYFGFCTSAADALTSPVTGSTVTISFAATIGDDVAGLFFSTGLTATARIYAPHDKANANASIATTATGVDTGVDIAAAGTYQRLRVEVDPDGTVRMFIDKVLKATFAAASLTTTTAVHPVIVLSTLTTANATLLVKHFGAWGART